MNDMTDAAVACQIKCSNCGIVASGQSSHPIDFCQQMEAAGWVLFKAGLPQQPLCQTCAKVTP